MSWSIAQVARMSGTTARTLRHYDAIGLLRPARVGSNGYRYYEREDLLRLQQILLLRQLGLGLDTIASVIAGTTSRIDALTQHRDWVLAERGRLGEIAATIEKTITELQGGPPMSGKDYFNGFNNNPYEAEAVERWGKAAVDASMSTVRDLTPEQSQQSMAGWFRSLELLQAARQTGLQPTDPAVHDAIDVHYRWLCTFWTPNLDSYTGLGRMYTDDDRFRASIEGDDPTRIGLADYLAEAMASYAQVHLPN
ncbi:MAG: MerR family transcriptional regulator [Actinomycetes bacterium]